MEISKEEILKIVDRCFHMYASSFRNDAKEEASQMIDDLVKVKNIAVTHCCKPKGTVKTKPSRKLKDFDVWYKPCERCGYDTGKSTKPKDGNKRCWKCGNFVQRDFTDRALKK